ncbi:MAG TPA: hypothetical protein VGD35_07800 [Chitinophaga sp.]
MKAVINCIGLLLLAIAVHAQSGVNLRRPLQIPAEHMRLDSLLNLVTRQTGARFSLNTRKIQPGKDIQLKKGSTTIGALLSHMQQSTGVHYILRGSHVIFLDNPPKPPSKKAAAVPVTYQQKDKASAPLVHQQKNKDTIVAMRPVSIPQLIQVSAVHTTLTPSISIRRHIPPKVFATNPIAEKKDRAEKREGRPLFEGRFGLNGDETFYVSPTAEIGLPYLFGTVSWNSNLNNLTGIRYGAGTAFRVFREWQLAFIATAGSEASQVYDSIIIKWNSKQQLYRGALLARRQLGKHWCVQFGPVFNMLKTSYYRDDEPAAPLVPAALADIRFHKIKPFYTIRDTYNPSSPTSTKLWIGFQAGVYYNIPFFRRR